MISQLDRQESGLGLLKSELFSYFWVNLVVQVCETEITSLWKRDNDTCPLRRLRDLKKKRSSVTKTFYDFPYLVRSKGGMIWQSQALTFHCVMAILHKYHCRWAFHGLKAVCFHSETTLLAIEQYWGMSSLVFFLFKNNLFFQIRPKQKDQLNFRHVLEQWFNEL